MKKAPGSLSYIFGARIQHVPYENYYQIQEEHQFLSSRQLPAESDRAFNIVLSLSEVIVAGINRLI